MEPHREEEPKALEPSAAPKLKRFRIVKLEERIAPGAGGKVTHKCPSGAYTCAFGTCGCTGNGGNCTSY